MGNKTVRTDIMIINKKKYYIHCKCGVVKDNIKCSYCNHCSNLKQVERYERLNNTSYRENLIEFVNRIEKRKGMASFYEVFVELISIFNNYYSTKLIDLMPVDLQLEYMYIKIKEKKRQVELIGEKTINRRRTKAEMEKGHINQLLNQVKLNSND
jgi:hypothetical protein